ncbi:hypothetical protein L218DRAFT_815873, partial [Marasmius fiardii PR-910]
MSARQGSRTIEQYDAYLRRGARRFGDITEHSLIQVLWKGVAQHTCIFWRSKGCGPEETEYDRLIKYAKRAQCVRYMIDEEERAFRGKPEGCTWGRFDNRSRGNTPWKPNTGPSDGKTLPSQTKPRSKDNTSNPRSTPYGSRTGSEVKKSSEPRQHRVKLSKEERDRLRAEGLCFNCRKPGHESRNCPDRHLAK